MSNKIEPMPIALVRQGRVHTSSFHKTVVHPKGARVGAAIAAVLAALLVSACSSKNPDALTGMNVDENLAMMDAIATSEANDAAGNPSDPSATSNHRSTDRSDQYRDDAAKADALAASHHQQRSAEVNASGTDADSPPDEDESSANQVQNDVDPPNGI